MNRNGFIIGVLFLLYGLLSFLEIKSLEFLFTESIMGLLILVGGFYLLSNSLKGNVKVKTASIVAGIILIFLGVFPLLINFKLLNINFVPILDIRDFLEIIIILYGLFLISDSFSIN